MAAGIQPLINCVNTAISNTTVLSANVNLEILQLLSINKDFEEGIVYSVSTIDELPSAECNKGRMIYVTANCSYRISNGEQWTNDFSSTPIFVPADESYAWAWGYNVRGNLGDGTTTSKRSPVSVVGGFTDWCQVSAGFCHSLGVRTNGTAWAWGFNSFGQLGTGNTLSRSSPVLVLGGFTDWCQVSAGREHSLGVRTNGTVWAWGRGSEGQLGNGTAVNRSSPVSVVGGFSDWCQVSGGGYHSLGIRTNGTAWAWGYNCQGQLGDGTAVAKSSPVSVVGGFTDWCQVSAGGNHSLGVRCNGTAWTWGCNDQGRLGDGTTVNKSSPVSVAGGFTNWCQVSAGGDHNLGVRCNGTIWAWGRGSEGQLGNGTAGNRSSPVSVVGGFTDWCQVSAGRFHGLGLRSNGTLWAWGYNNSGRLGDGTTVHRSSPVSVIGGFTDWCQVSAGGCHSLAIRRGKIIIKGF